MTKFEYDYYSGARSGQFRFLKTPKDFFEDPDYRGMKDFGLEEKVLYSFLLEHMDFSKRNGWVDEKGHTYVILPIEMAMQYIDGSEDKARKTLKNLMKIGLIEKIRRGQGKPDLIYVKDFVTKKTGNPGSEKTNKGAAQISESEKSGFLNPEKTDSRNGKNQILESAKNGSKETNIIETIYTDTPSIYPETVDTKESLCQYDTDGTKDERDCEPVFGDYARIIRESIDYDYNINILGADTQRGRLFDDFYSLIVEVMAGSEEEYRINKSVIKAEAVKSRMMKLTGYQILQAIEQYLGVTDRIIHVRSYMISVLYNASFITRNNTLTDDNNLPVSRTYERYDKSEDHRTAMRNTGWGGTNTGRIQDYDWEELERDMIVADPTYTAKPRDGNGLCKAG